MVNEQLIQSIKSRHNIIEENNENYTDDIIKYFCSEEFDKNLEEFLKKNKK